MANKKNNKKQNKSIISVEEIEQIKKSVQEIKEVLQDNNFLKKCYEETKLKWEIINPNIKYVYYNKLNEHSFTAFDNNFFNNTLIAEFKNNFWELKHQDYDFQKGIFFRRIKQ